MRFRLSCVAALFVCAASTAGAADLSAPDSSVAPGATAFIPVSISSNGDTVTGIEFDLSWDDPAIDVSVLVGDAARMSGKSLYVVSRNATRVHCLISGVNAAGIPDAVLVRLFVSIQPSATTRTVVLTFANAIASGPDGQPVALTTPQPQIQVDPNVAPDPIFQTQAIVNAASLAAGPVAPGEIIAIFGPGLAAGSPPFEPNDMSLMINGMPAPILYVGSKQINAIVPFGIDPSAPVSVTLSARTQTLRSLVLGGVAAEPALFTLDGSGTGPAVALNEDFSVNSITNPAQPGSIIVMWGTGFGATDPPGIDGVAAGIGAFKVPVTATIGGVDTEVLYAGPAPTLIGGVAQINLRIPSNISPGLVSPVVLRAGSTEMQSSVTISIK